MLGRARNGIGKVVKSWRLFWSLDRGHRFQTRYHSHRVRREHGETSGYRRAFNLICGPLLVVAGFVLLPTPGPSYIIIVIGLWMVAGEWLPMARLFDWVEVWLRTAARWAKDAWARASNAVRVFVVLGTAIALAYGIYYLFFGG